MFKKYVFLSFVTAVVLASCATSPTGRRQLQLFPDQEVAQMGALAFTNIKKDTPVSGDPAVNRYVQCVADHLIQVVPSPKGGGHWEVTVFKEDKTVNAFALPGGHIGVYTGLLKAAKSQAQLAAVIGHEIGHVEAEHANERLSTAYATETGLQLVQALAGSATTTNQRLMSLLGLGAQVGIILPFSRVQESEADVLGLQYMARAGFDPRQSIQLWRNMMQEGGAQPPEFLSTHPSGPSRIRDLEQRMPEAMKMYEQARAQGRRPSCTPPS
jgi:predicted Zn-dependent protease